MSNVFKLNVVFPNYIGVNMAIYITMDVLFKLGKLRYRGLIDETRG